MNLFKTLNLIIPNSEKPNIYIAILLAIIAGLLEILNLLFLRYFISKVVLNTNQQVDINYKFLDQIFYQNFSSNQLVYISFFVLAIIIISTFSRAFSFFWIINLSAKIGAKIAYTGFKKNINQPYDYHITSNSSRVIAALTTHVTILVGLIRNILTIFTSSLLILGILSFLIKNDPLITLISIISISFLYITIGIIFNKKLKTNSLTQKKYSKFQVNLVQDSFKSIRNIKMQALEEYFLDIFKKNETKLRSSWASNAFIAILPKYFIESFAIILFVLIIISSSLLKKDFIVILPSLASLAYGFQKLLPLTQQFYSAVVFLKGNRLSLYELESIIKLIQMNKSNGDFIISKKNLFKSKILLENIFYKYPYSDTPIFNNLTFEINKGKHIGIMGDSGSGKSTLLDLFSGLLIPSKGNIYIDNKKIDYRNFSSVKNLQSHITYVPQFGFIFDVSIRENIIFGSGDKLFNKEKYKNAIKFAQLDDFIRKLPSGDNTKIGENGVLISGGQRQRIALARAFYNIKEILILDEATSALDMDTEYEIIKCLKDLGKNITLIMVAHRKDSLTNCDSIIDFNSLTK